MQNHPRFLSSGATRCFERSAQGDPANIRAAAPDRAWVDAIVDPVAAAANLPTVFTAFGSNGPLTYPQVISGQRMTGPEGVSATVLFGQISGTGSGLGTLPGPAQSIEKV